MKSILYKLFRNFISPADFRREDIKSILVIRMNRIGDMIYAVPLVRTLRNEFPNAKITVLAESTNAEVIKCQPFVDKVLVYKRDTGLRRSRIINIMQTLKGSEFDLAIGVKGGFSSFLAMAALLSGAKFRAGYLPQNRRIMDRVYNLAAKSVDFSSIHQADACLKLLKTVGVTKEIRDISLVIPPQFINTALDFLVSNRIRPKERLVVFNISSNREKSTWRTRNFVELGQYLIGRYRCKCLITGVSSDEDKAAEISREIGDGSYLCKTAHVMDFAAVASMSNLLITGEGGASHIGAAAGTRVICLFGEANPLVWRPYGEQHIVLRQPDCDANSIAVETVIATIESDERMMADLNARETD